MNEWNSVDELLDYAIRNEEEAAAFYRELASRATTLATKQTFEGYAREEDGHKSKLSSVKASGTLGRATGTVLDLKIGDYLVDVEPTADMDYQQVLIVAMKKEKAAFRLYSDMAAATNDESLKELLLFLAQEEAKHKLHFEIEYDDVVLKEN